MTRNRLACYLITSCGTFFTASRRCVVAYWSPLLVTVAVAFAAVVIVVIVVLHSRWRRHWSVYRGHRHKQRESISGSTYVSTVIDDIRHYNGGSSTIARTISIVTSSNYIRTAGYTWHERIGVLFSQNTPAGEPLRFCQGTDGNEKTNMEK